MESNSPENLQEPQGGKQCILRTFPPLSEVNSPTVPTAPAAYYLNRKGQTMRSWACFGNGPIRPVRINGRLAWSVQAIKNLLTQGDEA
jgi:hypothetical protein